MRLNRKKVSGVLEIVPRKSYIEIAMLSLSKKVDYALLTLAYLVEHAGRISSARAISDAHSLPLPQLMNVLKQMHQKGILCSSRGSKGGYQICTSLDDVSLYDLIDAVEDAEDRSSPVVRRLSSQPPLRALQYKLLNFLRQVRLSDLVIAGRRIDVPVELITAKKCRCEEEQPDLQDDPEVVVTI